MATCKEATPPGVHMPGPWSGGDDSELDVFAAERYFNGEDALWCARSSSSVSSAFRTGTQSHDHDASVVTATAATSSSEGSWNSRSALLPDDKKVLSVTATAASVVEAEGSERPREGKPPPPPPPSSSLLRRWLLGVAGCACVGCDGESSVSAEDLCRDEEEEDHNGHGDCGKKLVDGAGELFGTTDSRVVAAAEATGTVRVRPGRWLDDGDEFLTGNAAFSPMHVRLAGDRAVKSGEFPGPILKSATTAASFHDQCRESTEMLRLPLCDIGKQDSAFTMAAGETVDWRGLHAAAGGGGRGAVHDEPGIARYDSIEDDAAPSELGCAYPPSEASVVWSVVTAEGAASCNFSSAASGYYYHFNGTEDASLRHDTGRSNRRRSGIVSNNGGLLTCMGDKVVSVVTPAHRDRRNRPSARHSDVMRRRYL